jgi:cell division septal protein FtsQ
MSDRQQNVTPRGKRTAKKQAPKSPKRRKQNAVRWLRWALLGASVCLVVAAYLAVANSAVFAVNRVEVEGAKRMPEEKVRAIVQKIAGPQMFRVDLDAVRKALEAESYVKTASVVRVLPDTLRVRIEEREPEVVARLRGGGFGWVDAEGHMLEGYTAPTGAPLPPPLLGYEDEDKSERAAADNHDRVARYVEIRNALADGKLWDRVDEVDLRYANDARLQLTESAIVVRVGDKDYRARLQGALDLLEAVRRGDVETLARYHVADVTRLLASADSINSIDMARSSGVSILCDAPRAGRSDALTTDRPVATATQTVTPTTAATAATAAPAAAAQDKTPKKSEPAKIATDTSAMAAKSGVAPQERQARPEKPPTDHGSANRDSQPKPKQSDAGRTRRAAERGKN